MTKFVHAWYIPAWNINRFLFLPEAVPCVFLTNIKTIQTMPCVPPQIYGPREGRPRETYDPPPSPYSMPLRAPPITPTTHRILNDPLPNYGQSFSPVPLRSRTMSPLLTGFPSPSVTLPEPSVQGSLTPTFPDNPGLAEEGIFKVRGDVGIFLASIVTLFFWVLIKVLICR